jgi:hypothetical protein
MHGSADVKKKVDYFWVKEGNSFHAPPGSTAVELSPPTLTIDGHN